MRTSYDVLKLFVVKEVQGLGRHLECKLCGAIFVSVKDASLHAVTHVKKGEVKVEMLKENKDVIRQEKKDEKPKCSNALLTRWLK